jgi:curli biogenesis system outer membrane secretion channel CsgG
MDASKTFGLISVLIFLFVLTSNYAVLNGAEPYSHAEKKAEAKTLGKEKIHTLALIPFSSKDMLSLTMSKDAIAEKERYLTVSMYDALTADLYKIKITPLQQSDKEFAKIKSETPNSYYREQAVNAGKILGVDAVMIGVISDYNERQGSGFGVESPAGVKFSVEVLDTKSARLIWQYYFTETQQPLLQNVFEINKFLKRGGRWITADELAKEGARKTADQFNKYLTEN